jgi:hypothetical protein
MSLPRPISRSLPVIDRSSVGLKLLRARPLSQSNEPLPTAGNRNATTTATAATPFIPLYIAAVTTTEQP